MHNENQLSERSGVSRSLIRDWRFKGSMPTPANVQRIADALGVSAENLWLRWLGYEPPEPGLSMIAKEIRVLSRTLRRAGAGDEQIADASAAVAAAREDLLEEPGATQPTEPVASSRRRKPDA